MKNTYVRSDCSATRFGLDRIVSKMNEFVPKHQFIPMEKFEIGQKYQVRLLYYHNPSRFSVYLRQKVGPLTEFQTELQHAMIKYRSSSSSLSKIHYQADQPVAAQDHHQIWHRATIVQLSGNGYEVRVYFVDVGLEETISLTNVRPLPHEFFRQVAFAIPCRLYQINPRNSTSQTSWQSNDPVHQEFQRLKDTILTCEVRRIEENSFYEVQLDVPDIGDIGTYLLKQNLVSRPAPPPPPPVRTIPIRRFVSPSTRIVDERTTKSQTIQTVPPDDGQYLITQVHSALEFYGYSQRRERELEALQKRFETLFNLSQDQTLSVVLPVNGTSCVVQQGDKYHRVVIKNRESDSRVLVKLIDRGDEILVDTSELIRLDDHLASVPAFAQPFRLFDFDETQSTANITRRMKRYLLNQRVQIKLHLPMINGFYPVEIFFNNGKSLNELLLSTDLPAPIPVTRDDDLPSPTRTLITPHRFQTIEQIPTRDEIVPSVNTVRSRSNPPVQRFFRGKRPVIPPTRREYVEPSVGFGGSPALRAQHEKFESAENYSEQILPRDKIRFVISHFEDVNDFFIQDFSTANDLSSLSSSLQTQVVESLDLPKKLLKANLPCLAKSTDGCWYRAMILSVDEKPTVRFVDFGDTLEVELKSIRQLEKKLATKPPYAYRCGLKDVQTSERRKIDDEFKNAFVGREFHGEFVDRGTLICKDLKSLLIELDAVKTMLTCSIVYVDADRNEFYVQTNEKLVEEIRNLIAEESTKFVRADDIRVGSMVIGMYEEIPYRARIESLTENDVEIYFVDYGNRCRTSKKSLKKCSDKLQSFADQARRCRSTGLTIDVEELTEPIEIQPIDENDDCQVLVYHQGQLLNDSLNSTMTTVKERQQPLKLSKGILTFIDEQQPIIYLQTNPNAELLLERINEQIDRIIREDRRLSSYKIDDDVVAQYNEDEEFYRGKIEKISTDNQTFTVVFIDYGNRDENVKKNQLYTSTNELKQILPLADEFHLEKLDENLRQTLKSRVNQTIEFDQIDPKSKLIRLRMNEKNDVQTYSGTISGVYQDRFYLHLRPNCDALICEMEELIESHPKNRSDQMWSLGDLCLIYDVKEDKNRRGKILNIDDERHRYDVQCIDYGYVLCAMEEKDLFPLENDEIFQREPLAQTCRLFGVSFYNQRLANAEVIQRIPPTEIVTITVQKINEQNEMLVMLFRANDDIVNDHYQSKSPIDMNSDPHMTSLIGIPQAESTHQYADLTQRSFSMTIDFGENDPSTTTIRED